MITIIMIKKAISTKITFIYLRWRGAARQKKTTTRTRSEAIKSLCDLLLMKNCNNKMFVVRGLVQHRVYSILVVFYVRIMILLCTIT